MWNHSACMARSKPDPDPRPTDGGSYLLDEATGKWIDQDAKPAECVMPCPIDIKADASLDA
jgi:hypothetical protein